MPCESDRVCSLGAPASPYDLPAGDVVAGVLCIVDQALILDRRGASSPVGIGDPFGEPLVDLNMPPSCGVIPLCSPPTPQFV